ncbi:MULTISPECIES: restriction endonuclease [Agrobacterium]|uniref:restriction endonuclease n=1 Tax=Agrobacterium tumefaciens TaxID=358 RepID=UPI000EF1A462|nr:hypothetical protein At1D1108_50290 [Agrobacterium tumefaciens]NSY09777.1 restriction endonuclease [Agrobacterium tumefaciens]NSY93366.1 restriction endonuclease [Agrobacterium tumefaciens]
MRGTEDNSIMAALEQFEATEANLVKLERICSELQEMVPEGISFGEDVEYEERTRSFELLLNSLPMINGWKPTAMPADLNGIAQSRFDAMEIDEPSTYSAIESWIEEPGRALREYRFRMNTMRRALIRDALVVLIDQVDADLRSIRSALPLEVEANHRLDREAWSSIRDHIKQIEVLLGSSVQKPPHWQLMLRHIHFGYVSDLIDIENADWPNIKSALRKGLYGANEPIPVRAKDLSELVASRPKGPISTALAWSEIDDGAFERLIFTLISDTPGYLNPEWLMQTRAPDRGRDLSVTRETKDELSGTLHQRVVIQCKHWLSKSVGVGEAATAKEQMSLWEHPKVDVLIIATSGRFTADGVSWIEKHNSKGEAPRIEMWPESHLERLLSARPAIIAEFALRGG